METYFRIIMFEIILILLFMYYLNIYNFLEVENIKNPFNENSRDFLRKALNYGFVIWILSWDMGIFKLINLESLLILSLIKHLISKGISKE